MNCPSCDAPLDNRGIDLDAGTVRCFNCGHVSKLSTGAETPQVQRLPQPAGTRVVLDRSRPGEIVLSVPSKGGLGMIVFALAWLGFTIALASTFIAGGAPLSVLAFFALFFLIGLSMLTFGLFTRYGITGVYIDSTQYLVTKKLWGKGWTRRGPLDTIDSISIAEAYRQNERPVTAVTINIGSKTIKFGSFLTDEEKQWIASELRAFMAEIDRPLG